jgi:hypothetical protein
VQVSTSHLSEDESRDVKAFCIDMDNFVWNLEQSIRVGTDFAQESLLNSGLQFCMKYFQLKDTSITYHVKDIEFKNQTKYWS